MVAMAKPFFLFRYNSISKFLGLFKHGVPAYKYLVELINAIPASRKPQFFARGCDVGTFLPLFHNVILAKRNEMASANNHQEKRKLSETR